MPLNLIRARFSHDDISLPICSFLLKDRAFRIGQKRDVHVYRLVALGSLEELVYHRQLYKQQQSDAVVMGVAQRRYFTGKTCGIQ